MKKLLLSMILLGVSFVFGSVFAAQAAQPAQPYDVCAMNEEDDDDDAMLCGPDYEKAGSVVAMDESNPFDSEDDTDDDSDDDDDSDED